MIKLKYYKYHALGNSFILINKNDNILKTSMQIKRILSTDIGIGADGLLIFDLTLNSIEFYNYDGSYANFCGNGIRAYFAHLFNHNKDINQDFVKTTFGGATYSGKVIKKIDDYNYCVTVKVKNNNPIIKKITYFDEDIKLIGYEIKIGVNHFIIEKEEAENYKYFEKIKNSITLLEKIQKSSYFIETPNIDLIEKNNNKELKITTFERGVGFTSSCGSGAIASCYVNYMNNGQDKKIMNYRVISKYGKTKVKITNNNLFLTGLVTFICDGEYYE